MKICTSRLTRETQLFWLPYFEMAEQYYSQNEPGNLENGALRKGVKDYLLEEISEGRKGAVILLENDEKERRYGVLGYSLFTPASWGRQHPQTINELFLFDSDPSLEEILVIRSGWEIREMRKEAGLYRYDNLYIEVPNSNNNHKRYGNLKTQIKQQDQNGKILMASLSQVLKFASKMNHVRKK